MISRQSTSVPSPPPGRCSARFPTFPDLLSSAGFTLVELITVAAILGVIVVVGVAGFDRMVNKAKNSRGMAEIRNLEKDISAYMVDQVTLPNTLADIGRGGMLDPWGNPYQYLKIANGGAPRQVFGTNINRDDDYDLFSLGKDGLSNQSLLHPTSQDDIVRGAEGRYVGLATGF